MEIENVEATTQAMATELENVEATTEAMATEIENVEASIRENSQNGIEGEQIMLELRKYILLLATLVATVTYAAGFNPPGGVWQDTDDAAGHFAGDPIIWDTHRRQYLVFFYCNATAFASSLVVIILVRFFALLHEKRRISVSLLPLRVVMVLDLLSLMGAYAASTWRDTPTTIYSSLLVAVVFIYLILQMVLAWLSRDTQYPYSNDDKRLRKVLMLLAMFAVSVTYMARMSTPGGFWDNTEGRHRPGDAVLKDRQGARLTAFFCCNNTVFIASLLIIVVLLDRKPRLREAYGCIIVALLSLVGAYTAASCKGTDTTVYVVSLVGAILAYVLFLQSAVVQGFITAIRRHTCVPAKIKDFYASVLKMLREAPRTTDGREAADKTRSLVLLLATLAATITYQAGLDPPGGVWSDNGDDHKAGDPILETMHPRRYKAFFFSNSVSFVASLVAIILVQQKLLLKTHVLEAAMILDLFGLIAAYSAGSCRDISTSIYAIALAGAVFGYVVMHVVFFTLDHGDAGREYYYTLVEKRRKRLLLVAVLGATITYQAGLTPPGGFRLQDDGSNGLHAGDPVLLDNSPHRYKAFFYCNSVSFMLSIVLIILLVNPHLYRLAIRSYALAVCAAAGLFGLMGAYAAGSTRHLKTSLYVFIMLAVVLFIMVVQILVLLARERKRRSNYMANEPSSEEKPTGAWGKQITTDACSEQRRPPRTEEDEAKEKHDKRKYLMLIGILVASVTYQAGLDPPGGAWQRSGDGYEAGNPVMHDNMRQRYLTFFYSNSTSFVASIVVIILLLPEWLHEKKWSLKVMDKMIVLDLLALLVAYAAGSSRGWKTSVYVVLLGIVVLAYVAIYVTLSFLCSPTRGAVINS